KNILIVGAPSRELRNDCSFRPRLEPVPRVGKEGVLFARFQADFVPYRVVSLGAFRWAAGRLRRRRAGHIQIDGSPATAERLLLPWSAAQRGRPVFRAGLVWQHHEFLGTDTIRIYVSNDLETGLFKLSQTEIRHLETGSLLGR